MATTQYTTWTDIIQLGVPPAIVARFVSMSAVGSTGTTPPAITLSGAPLEPITLQVQCQVGGALGTWSGRYSIDGGVTWTPFVSAAVVELFDGSNVDTGVALNIAAGNAATNNVWTANSISSRLDSLILAQCSIANGYITASGKVLPLVSWGEDLKQCVAKLLAYELMRLVGYNPETPGNSVWRDGFNDAMGWLRDLAAGRASNVNMIEATPTDTKADRIEVYTEKQRGW